MSTSKRLVVDGHMFSPVLLSYLGSEGPPPPHIFWAEVLLCMPLEHRIEATRHACTWAWAAQQQPEIAPTQWVHFFAWLDGALHEMIAAQEASLRSADALYPPIDPPRLKIYGS